MDALTPDYRVPKELEVKRVETHLPPTLVGKTGEVAFRTITYLESEPRPSENAAEEEAFEKTVGLSHTTAELRAGFTHLLKK